MSIICRSSIKNDAPRHVTSAISDYTLACDANFRLQQAIDPTKFGSSYLWGPNVAINNEEQIYIDVLGGSGPQIGNPFSFNQDGLLITAEPITGSKPIITNGLTGGQNYISGALTTRTTPNPLDNLCFKGGYFEWCGRIPCNADGAWPAFWLLNCFYYDNADQKNETEGGTNDKFNPEIDWEFVDTGNGTMCAKTAYHYFTGDRNDPSNYSRWSIDPNNFVRVDGNTGLLQSQFNVYQDCDGINQFKLDEVCPGVDLCEDFHTYGIDWCPNDYIHWYLDGELVRCIDGADNIVTDQAMYPLMNFAVGGGYPKPDGSLVDPNDYPASLGIEYFRAYAKELVTFDVQPFSLNAIEQISYRSMKLAE